MGVALGVVGGVVFGALVTWIVAARRAQGLRDGVAVAQRDLAVRDSQLSDALDTLAREREDRAREREEVDVHLESVSNRVLGKTVEDLHRTQTAAQQERDARLDEKLRPLEMLLAEYKLKLDKFNEDHTGAMIDVRNQTGQLLTETQRFNQLLGRSDHRGRWGEVQLANVLEQSGLRPSTDFELQVTSTTEDGKGQRPDCVVKLPNGTQLAVDAKFPFDRFEEAMAAEGADERRRLYEAHAADLRGHVKKLGDKAYWEAVRPAPEFVVCFVPSDAAISAAFEHDPGLQEYAAKERVLIAGPTNLLSLLWTVAMVVRQEHARVNAEQILSLASELYDRISKVAEPTARVGKALNDAVRQYNSMVASFESRLIVTANKVRGLGGAPGTKSAPALGPVNELTVPLNDAKWGTDDDAPRDEGAFEILDLEGDEEP